ncbi:hypothetical protein [Cellulomonas soli]|uniref:Uncharacterized protein n=1 Tax=Cellulomonas soli TaxID=931535 RepID=A0A512PHU1_9CELL|nr:hypothetical protein [Cellulomonas soli]NYI59277.1 hypothetical protein [Cellulomonas soli]GEP70781.1 hypothetical protein CSO01_34960 [Cellulomonas soli]
MDEIPTWSQTTVRATLAAIPYVGGALEIVYSDVRARRAARADELVSQLITATGEDRLLKRLRDSPEVEAVFVTAIDAALRSSVEAKRRRLVKAVSAAVLDDARVDESLLVADALSQLDVPHLLALARMADEWEVTRSDMSDAVRWGASNVFAATPEAIRAALVRTGTAKSSVGTYIALAEPSRQDGITDFGLSIVADLRAEDWPE